MKKKNVSIWALSKSWGKGQGGLGTTAKQKKRFRIGGGGLPLPEFFCALFYLRKKSRQWSRRRKESVKLPELGGERGGFG